VKKFLLNILYIFNSSLAPGIFCLISLFGKKDYAIYVNLLFSISLFFTASFSSYNRQMILLKKDVNFCRNIILSRIKIFPFALVFIFLFSKYYLKIEDLTLIFATSLLIFTLWIAEMLLAIDEITNKKKFLFNYLFIILSGLLFLYLIFFSVDLYFSYYVFFFCICYLFINIYGKLDKIIYLKKGNFNRKDKTDYLGYFGYVSTFLTSLSLLINKILIYHNFNIVDVNLLFLSFTFVSFFSTIAFSSFGPQLFTNKINIRHIVWCIIFYLTIITTAIFYLFLFKKNLSIIYLGIISCCSGVMSFVAYAMKQRILGKKNFIHVIINDIFLSIFSTLTIIFIIFFAQYFVFYFILLYSFIYVASYFIIFILTKSV
jgi:hypothetical protein